MTIEIRELIVKVEVIESAPPSKDIAAQRYSEWNEERLLEKLRREMLDLLRERGNL
ncbi:DUF5908 family protein [Enterobacter ludwigii]